MKRFNLPNVVVVDVPKLLAHGKAEFIHCVSNDPAEIFVTELPNVVADVRPCCEAMVILLFTPDSILRPMAEIKVVLI